MGIKSKFLSTTMRTGLDDGVPAADEGFRSLPEKRLSLELRMWSRSFLSSFAAIISAAPPLGHRRIGIVPAHNLLGQESLPQGDYDVPIVTTTLKRPLTIRSIVASSSSSLVSALLIVRYVSAIPRLKRSGSLTIKLRYWS